MRVPAGAWKTQSAKVKKPALASPPLWTCRPAPPGWHCETTW
jgi:hypothetical protein